MKGALMHRTTVLAAAVALLGWIAPASPPAQAATSGDAANPNPDDTHCLAVFDVTFDPGFSMTPASGTFTTEGETGTTTCDGPVHGFDVTGPGTRGEFGPYGLDGPNSCTDLDGTAEMNFSFTVPTTGGPQQVTGTAPATYGPLQQGGLVGGTFKGERMYGKFTVTPLEGDCFNTPVTKVRAYCDEWVVTDR